MPNVNKTLLLLMLLLVIDFVVGSKAAAMLTEQDEFPRLLGGCLLGVLVLGNVWVMMKIFNAK